MIRPPFFDSQPSVSYFYMPVELIQWFVGIKVLMLEKSNWIRDRLMLSPDEITGEKLSNSFGYTLKIVKENFKGERKEIMTKRKCLIISLLKFELYHIHSLALKMSFLLFRGTRTPDCIRRIFVLLFRNPDTKIKKCTYNEKKNSESQQVNQSS